MINRLTAIMTIAAALLSITVSALGAIPQRSELITANACLAVWAFLAMMADRR